MDEISAIMKNKGELSSYKYVMLLGASVVLLAIVVFIILMPVWQKHIFLEKEYKLYEERIRALESYSIQHRSYETEYVAKQGEYVRLRERLPLENQGQDYIGQLQQLARGQGVALVVARNSEPAKKLKGLTSIVLDVRTHGSYGSVKRFLETLEKEGPYVIDKIKVEGNNEGLVNVSARIMIYSSK